MAKHEFKHVTEEQRKSAVVLWNGFNSALAALGMKLMYDYDGGGFFVVSDELDATDSMDDPDNLDEEELEQVVNEGGFRWDETVNNPPWFTGCGETLRVSR